MNFPHSKSQAGFTLVELLIYVSITAIILGMFSAILITITRVQSRETSASKNINELGFLMTEMKRLIRSAVDLNVAGGTNSSIDLIISATTTPVTTLTISHVPASNSILLASNGPSGAASSTLSSSQIRVDSLTFRELSSGASKSVNISLTGTVFPNNATLKLTRTLESTAALYVQEP